MYTHGVYVRSMCVCLLGVYLQPCYCRTWSHGAAATPPLSGCRIQHDAFLSKKYHKHQITICPQLGNRMEKGKKIFKKKEREKEKETTHLCINFPGTSFTRTPFSIGFPSFPDGLFVSGGGGSKHKNSKQKDTKVSFQS